MNRIARFLKDESGATAIEYGLLAAGISIAIITAVYAIGGELANMFGTVQSELENRGAEG